MNTVYLNPFHPNRAFVRTLCPTTGKRLILSANCSVRQLAIWLNRADTAQDAVQIAEERAAAARMLLQPLRHARAMRAYQRSLAN